MIVSPFDKTPFSCLCNRRLELRGGQTTAAEKHPIKEKKARTIAAPAGITGLCSTISLMARFMPDLTSADQSVGAASISPDVSRK